MNRSYNIKQKEKMHILLNFIFIAHYYFIDLCMIHFVVMEQNEWMIHNSIK